LPAILWQFRGHINTRTDPPNPEPIPVEDVQVALYGSSVVEEMGELLASTRSEEDGSYSLSYGEAARLRIRQDYEYFHIVITDALYRVVEANSGSVGEATEQGWIRFHEPEPGDYPDNDFIVETEEVIERFFSGHVYRGEVGDRSEPWPHAPVGLLKAVISCEEGLVVAEVETDDWGYFELGHVTPVEEDAPYYNLIVPSEDIHIVGAESMSGGQPTNQGWLQFEQSSARELTGNDFFAEVVYGEQVIPAADADAYVSAQAPDGNSGSTSTLITSFSSGPDLLRNRAFVYFNLSYIPSDATVTKATLNLYLEAAGGEEKVCMSVHRARQNWGETTITWNNQPSYNLMPSATHYVDKTLGYKTWDVTSLVQSWIDGSESNYGVAVVGPEEGNYWSRIFSSKEGTNWPRLVIHLVTSTPFNTPTPTATPTSTPTPTVTPTPVSRQVQITAVEITQAIQDQNTTQVPLIAGKKMVVRVHLKVVDGQGNLPGVYGQVHYPYGYGGVFYSINTVTARTNPDRGQFSHSLNFVIPGQYAQGTNQGLFVRVFSPSGVTFPGIGELQETRLLNFSSVPAMELRLVGVSYITNTVTYTPRNLDYARVESWLRAAYPIGALTSSRTTTSYPSNKGMPTCGEVNKLLAQMKVTDVKNKVATTNTRYHGLVFEGSYFMQGCCCASGASSGPTGGTVGVATWGWDTDGTYGDWYAGHEIGHGYGLCHPGYCRGQGEDTSAHCAKYPYPNGVIGGPSSDPNRFYGLDVETLQVYGPTSKDMMTYCNDLWISDFQYNRIRNKMISALPFSLVKATPDERLLVVGTIDLETDAVELDPFLRVLDASETVERTPGEYSIVLSDGGGMPLAEYPFTPRVQGVEESSPGAITTMGEGLLTELPSPRSEIFGDREGSLPGAICSSTGAASAPDDPAYIFEFVPWHPDTARISIWHGEQVLAGRDVSPNPPTVQVISPNGGEVVEGESAVVTWSGSDADGDPLTFTLLYSADGGETWLTLATDIEDMSYEVDTSLLAGSEEALVRVMASDGVNTTSDESDAYFTLADSIPQVSILWPTDRARFTADDVVVLTGDAYDPEDGSLTGEALVWESDQDGLLGSDTSLILATQNLTFGPHHITLRATDSDDMEGSASVNIFVGHQVYLPVILKGYP